MGQRQSYVQDNKENYLKGLQQNQKNVLNDVAQVTDFTYMKNLIIQELVQFRAKLMEQGIQQETSIISQNFITSELFLKDNSQNNILNSHNDLFNYVNSYDFSNCQLSAISSVEKAFLALKLEPFFIQKNWKQSQKSFYQSILISLSNSSQFIFCQIIDKLNYHLLTTYDKNQVLTCPNRRFPQQSQNQKNKINLNGTCLNSEECQMIIKQFSLIIRILKIIIQVCFDKYLDQLIPENIEEEFRNEMVFREIFYQKIAEKITLSDKFRIRLVLNKAIIAYEKIENLYREKGSSIPLISDIGELKFNANFCDLTFKKLENIIFTEGFISKIDKILIFSHELKKNFIKMHPGEENRMQNAEERTEIIIMLFQNYILQNKQNFEALKKLHYQINMMEDKEYNIVHPNIFLICQSISEFSYDLENIIIKNDSQ